MTAQLDALLVQVVQNGSTESSVSTLVSGLGRLLSDGSADGAALGRQLVISADDITRAVMLNTEHDTKPNVGFQATSQVSAVAGSQPKGDKVNVPENVSGAVISGGQVVKEGSPAPSPSQAPGAKR